MHRVDLHERHFALFTNEGRFPKPDATGSNPVSRSTFSIIYVEYVALMALLIELRTCRLTREMPVFIGVRDCECQPCRLASLI